MQQHHPEDSDFWLALVISGHDDRGKQIQICLQNKRMYCEKVVELKYGVPS